MRKFAVLFFSLILCGTSLSAKNASDAAPQTARQALLEMFFSKEPGTLLKHLPAVTRAAIEKSGAMSGMQQYSLLAGQWQTQGKTLQTFEAGSVLLVTEDAKTGQKFEVVIDDDSLQGDQDDIALSFHTHKDNQARRTPFMPRVVFSMKMEAGQWTLHDIAITMNLPLADPDLLKTISDGMKARAAVATPQIQVQGQGAAPGITYGSDAGVLAAVRKIVAAETTYAATYPGVGYTCILSDLDGFGSAEANEHQAMLISSGLASGKYQGYTISITGCSGAPAAHFHLSAAPSGTSYGRRAFCSDESGTVRASADGNANSCLSGGTPAQ